MDLTSTRSPDGLLTARIEADIERCLRALDSRLTVCATQTDSHILLEVSGLDASVQCLDDLAVYCVGQIAKAIQLNLRIRADLLDGVGTSSARTSLMRDIHALVGRTSRSLKQLQKRDERDPWLFETLSHLLVYLSTRKPGLLPVGRLVALTMTHGKVKEQGLDLVALYDGPNLGLSIGESKAWKKKPSQGLNAAATKFSKVDSGEYDSEIRATVGQMREALPPIYQSKITGMFWSQERAYMPFVGYSSDVKVRWFQRRVPLSRLDVPLEKRIVIPIEIDGFRSFFDSLANAIRRYAASL